MGDQTCVLHPVRALAEVFVVLGTIQREEEAKERAMRSPREVLLFPHVDLQVLNRTLAESVGHTSPHAVISITDPTAPDCDLQGDAKNRVDVLRLKFHDVDAEGTNCLCMTQEQADRIAGFVAEMAGSRSVRLFVIHCEAGYSRSAGVAAAISRALNDVDAPFFDYFQPNFLVYTRVLDAFDRLKSDDDTEDDGYIPFHKRRVDL